MQSVTANQVAACCGETQLHGLAAIVIGGHIEKYCNSGRQVLTARALRTKAAAAARDKPGLLRFEQMWCLTRDAGCSQLFEELQVVQHPEAASERRENHGVLLGLNFYIAYAHCRQIEIQRLPLLASVEAEVHGRAGSGEKQIGV